MKEVVFDAYDVPFSQLSLSSCGFNLALDVISPLDLSSVIVVQEASFSLCHSSLIVAYSSH